jgi:RimJ/RimL family protein N-acetyltransferase
VRIREASPDDARSIAEVHVRSWRWAYRGLIPDRFLARLSVDDREARWREGLVEQTSSRGCVVAEDEDGRVVGFAGFGAAADPATSPEGAGEVHATYLDESVAGSGVGRELFAAASDGLRTLGFSRAFLWVLGTNDRARRFYEKAGWSWDGAESSHQFDCANEPIVRYAVELD